MICAGRRPGSRVSRIARTTSGGTSASRAAIEDRGEEQGDRAPVRPGEPPHPAQRLASAAWRPSPRRRPAASCGAVPSAWLEATSASRGRRLVRWRAMSPVMPVAAVSGGSSWSSACSPSLRVVLVAAARRRARRHRSRRRNRDAGDRRADHDTRLDVRPERAGDSAGDRQPAGTRAADHRSGRRADRVAAVRRRASTSARSPCRSTTPIRDGPTFELHLARHRARPGPTTDRHAARQPGRTRLRRQRASPIDADYVYDQALLDQFDIIGWDPRGTGKSDAGDRLHRRLRPVLRRLDVTPDTPSRAPADRRPRRGVRRRLRQPRTARSSNTSAPTTRPATWTSSGGRSARTRSRYFGFSYGSELGATWATLFPDTVRAAVLDGAADPNADPVAGQLEQLQGFEARSTRSSPMQRATPTARSTTAATPRAPSTR